jgi:hypothetical protein
MTSYRLVRVVRSGRQSIDESTHLIELNADLTVCGENEDENIRSVRTLGLFSGNSPMCSECAKKADNVLDI